MGWIKIHLQLVILKNDITLNRFYFDILSSTTNPIISLHQLVKIQLNMDKTII